jgi:uncharacterized membrane protein (UPF0127 family)
MLCRVKFIPILLSTISAGLLFGCGDDRTAAPSSQQNTTPGSAPTAESAPSSSPNQAQPRLATEQLWVGTNQITAEIARTHAQRMAGLMWRTNMAEMEGMLFIFPGAQQLGFWMKNTILPLTCAYIGPDGTILELHDMEPHNTNAIMSTSDQIQFVLEMNRDWFKKHNVSTGVVVQASRGTLSQVFLNQ